MTAPSLIADHLRRIGRQYLYWQRTTAERLRVSLAAPKRRFAVFAALCGCAFGAAAAALGFASPTLFHEPPAGWEVVTIPGPDIAEKLEVLAEATDIRPLHHSARPGETLLSLLCAFGVKDPQAYAFIRSRPELRALVMPQEGQYFTAGLLSDGRLAYLRLYMEGPHAHDSRTIEVMRAGDILMASTLPFAFETEEVLASGTAEKTLWSTYRKLKLPEEVVDELEAVWDGARNPVTELKSGDLPAAALKILYSPAYEKAMNDAAEWQPFLNDLVRIFSFGFGLEMEKTLAFTSLPIKWWIKPYIHVNESAMVADLASAVQNGFVSRHTASERVSMYSTAGEWERIVREEKEQQRNDLLSEIQLNKANQNKGAEGGNSNS